MINKSNIGELTIEQKDFRITIKQKEEHITQLLPTVQAAPMVTAVPQAISQAMPAATAAPDKDKTKASEQPSASNLITIKSPMIGTFYRRSSPDKPNLIEIGDEVTPGKVVCII